MLAYRLAMAGEHVLVINSGSLPEQSEFQNEMSPEQQGHFGIRQNTRFPAKAEISLTHPLVANTADKSSTPAGRGEFDHCQIHHVNGLQNLWNGVCLRYSEDDFANRNSYNKECEWPIAYTDLAPHYAAVETLAHVIGEHDRLNQFPDGSFLPPRGQRYPDRVFLDGNAKLFGPDLFCLATRKAVDLRAESAQQCVSCGSCNRGCRSGSVYKFSTHLLPQIQNRQNFRLLNHARVTKIAHSAVSDDSGSFSVSEIVAIDEQSGDVISIQADVVILCTGAIESPRIILNSLSPERTEQVGLYLQDSPRTAVATSLFRLWFKPLTADKGYGDHVMLGGHINAQGRPVQFVGQFYWSTYAQIPYYLTELQSMPHFLRETIARQIYKSTVALMFFAPAIPRRENRVVLAKSVDRFAQRLVQIQYEMAEREIEYTLMLAALARKMLRNASGYVANLIPSPPGTGVHYVGTCRMAPNADRGVVDKNLKVFGATNLYVCDGSVVPALNEKHPSLTIMALAHRLGEHLVETYR